jgi:hypothetical protein
MLPGTWTCAYVSGGPGGAYFLNNPSTGQSLIAGGTITFTFDFELNQDAAIKFWAWSQNGVPLQGPVTQIEAMPCMIIDAHFNQWVKGCDGYNVTMNEASWLTITQMVGPPGVVVYVVDDPCAVNKTPAPRQKVSQTASVDNVTRLKGYNVTLQLQTPTLLDVHTQWQLVKGVNYTKSINWFGIWVNAYEPGLHPCVLFELILPPGPAVQYIFQIQTSADVTLVGDTDVDPGNNHDMSAPIMLIVNAGP